MIIYTTSLQKAETTERSKIRIIMAEHLISFQNAQEDLLSCATYLAETINSADGYANAMSEIVPRYISKGDVDFAAELADSVNDPFVRDRLLTIVIEKCAAIDDDEYAFQLLEAIEDDGTRAVAREKIALQKSAKDETEKALELVENLSHPDDAYADIALHQIAKGEETEAFATLEKIDFPNAKATAFQNIALHYLKNDEFEKASETLEKATDAADTIGYKEEKVRALVDVAAHFVKAGQTEKALETLEKARNLTETIDGVHRDNLFAKVSNAFLHAGSIEAADRTLDLVADKTQMAACLLGFSGEFWKKNEKEEAVETLEEAYAILKSQRDNEIRDSRARFGLLGSAAVQYAKFEKAERAIEIAQDNIDDAAQISALMQIAQICTLQKKDELANAAINAIYEDARRMFALIGVSDAKNQLGEREKAIEILNEAATLNETVPQIASRSEAYGEIAKRFHAYGITEKARKLLTRNLEVISEIRDQSNCSIMLAELAAYFDQENFKLTDAEKEILKTMARKAEW